MTYHNVEIFGIELTLREEAFSIGGWTVYWYGIIIGLGCLLALIYGMKNAPRFNLDRDRMLDVVIFTIPVAVLGARFYYCIFADSTGNRIDSVKEFFGIGSGTGFSGLAIYGAVIAAFAFGSVMCIIRKVKIFDMFDIAAVGFIIGQAIGRWGNFINQEAYGTFTGSSWWGMMSETTAQEMGKAELVHPCFLYESIWCIIGFFVLNHISKKRKFSGQVVLSYAIWYGFGRFFIEALRTDALPLGKMRVSMLVSAIAFIGGIVLMIVLSNKSKEKAESAPYEPLFDSIMDDESIAEEENEEENEAEFFSDEEENAEELKENEEE